jgi:hypothetical protein
VSQSKYYFAHIADNINGIFYSHDKNVSKNLYFFGVVAYNIAGGKIYFCRCEKCVYAGAKDVFMQGRKIFRPYGGVCRGERNIYAGVNDYSPVRICRGE